MNRIKEYRTNLGITQQQLADELGVYQATVNRYEKGRDPNLKTCWRIINSLRSLGAKCGIEDVFPDNTTTKKSA
ncbi:helix-turn-helix domain-containing protein [Vibrio parahaemolyticus]|nr:helix-turn-helix domain-containing protein [Vibrio parahaemolyticus]